MLVQHTRSAGSARGFFFLSLCVMALPRRFVRTLRSVAADSSVTHRLRQVQVIHRHGDRSPITPLKDETFWSNLLIPPDVLEKVAQGTTIVRNPNEINTHVAGGRGPFGKLTALGVLQMVQVGTALRERFVADDDCDSASSSQHHLWDNLRPLQSIDVRVFSTDFPRTIQSVQGLLSGLFPDGISTPIAIDVRPTPWMIPDPMPRLSKEQEELEKVLAAAPRVREREQELRPLAVRVTQALHEYLAPDAHDAAFGVEGEHPGEASIEIQPLAWVQLAEITKCMAVREMLPPTITQHDQETIAAHAAWRWFQTLSHPRMAFLGMHRLVQQQIEYMEHAEKEPPMIIWSGHDSTLIGLLCAYRLERPTTWPEYASYLCLELIEVITEDPKSNPNQKTYVRFSLNGEILKSHWENDEPREMIPLELLKQNVYTVGVHPEKVSSSIV